MRNVLSATAPIVATLALTTLALTAAPASAQQGRVVVFFEGTPGGKASVDAARGGTTVEMALVGFPPNTQATATLHAGTCAQPGASAASVASGVSNELGHVTLHGPVLFRGSEPVAFETVADGEHVMIVRAGSATACGVIPRQGVPIATPTAATPVAPRTGNAGQAASSATAALLVVGVAAAAPLIARRVIARR